LPASLWGAWGSEAAPSCAGGKSFSILCSYSSSSFVEEFIFLAFAETG